MRKEPGGQQAWLDPNRRSGWRHPSDSSEAPEQTHGDEKRSAGEECTHGRGRGEAGHAPEHGGEVAGGAGSAPDLGFGRLAERESAAESGPRDRRGGARADRRGCGGGGSGVARRGRPCGREESDRARERGAKQAKAKREGEERRGREWWCVKRSSSLRGVVLGRLLDLVAAQFQIKRVWTAGAGWME